MILPLFQLTSSLSYLLAESEYPKLSRVLFYGLVSKYQLSVPKLYVLIPAGSSACFEYILQNVAKTVRLQLCFSKNSESQFPLLAAFSFRFIISDENAVLNLICLEEFPPKMNLSIV